MINNLSPALLIDVFSDVVFSKSHHSNEKTDKRALLSLCAVSSSWRAVCRQYPRFWGDYALHPLPRRGSFQDEIQRARHWFAIPRSTSHPLSITVTITDAVVQGANSAFLASFLDSFRDRVSHLSLHFADDREVAGWALHPGVWSVMTQLEVDIQGSSFPLFLSLLQPALLPSLTSFAISAPELPALQTLACSLPSRLTRLELGPCDYETLVQLLLSLCRFPRLEHLAFDISDSALNPGPASQLPSATPFVNLQSFHLEIDGAYEALTTLFKHLRAPTLQSLSFLISPPADPFVDQEYASSCRDECSENIADLSYITEHLTSPSPVLTNLLIDFEGLHSCTNSSLASLLASLPTLLTLSLNMPCSSYRPLRTSLHPRLRELHLTCSEPRRASVLGSIRTALYVARNQPNLLILNVNLTPRPGLSSPRIREALSASASEAKHTDLPLLFFGVEGFFENPWGPSP